MVETQKIKVCYKAAFRAKKLTGIIISQILFLILGIMHLIKLFNGSDKFGYYDIIWPVSILIFSYALIELISEKTVFDITGLNLTVSKSSFFYKKVKTYDIKKMEETEVEQVKVKTFLPPKTQKTGAAIVTFFYNDKEVALGFNLEKFNAEELATALLAIK